MANNSKNNRKRPTGQKGRPTGNGNTASSSGAASGTDGASSGSVGGSVPGDGASSASGAGAVRTTTTTVREVDWERRKAWPLLLGGAVALTGLSAVNYSWANPDGRLSDKAQDALSAKFPGAEVRVHGRDAIITGLPAGVDVDAAHDLVRNVEGVRNVKEDFSAGASDATDTSAAEAVAVDTVVAETVVADTAVASPAAAETAPEEAVTDPDTGATDSVAGETDAVEAVAAPAVAAETAPAETVPPTTAAPSTAPATTAAPATTVAPATVAPTTIVAEAPPTAAPAAPADAPEAAADTPPVNIQFDSVSAELDGDSTTSVDQLVAYMEANPDVRIKVIGHADNLGTRLTNLAISRARADAVVAALVSAGIDRGRISAFAQGDRLPIESNATAEGRRANRRVDIVFFGAEGTGDREVAFTG